MQGLIFIAYAFLLASQAGCWHDESCGDGLVGSTEQCDDGNNRSGDGCDSSCAIERGWNCVDTLCRPACGDGIFIRGEEICDPSESSWAGYCAEDCSEVTGWCGDGIIQPEQESCDGQRGCDHDCTAAYGFTCEGDPVACSATGLPGDRLMEELSSDEMTTYCTWLVSILGGQGASFTCTVYPYEYTFTVSSVDECVASSADINFQGCTVGDMENFMAAGGDRCGVMFDDPACMS
jgi:cysteine-rich repeat protein